MPTPQLSPGVAAQLCATSDAIRALAAAGPPDPEVAAAVGRMNEAEARLRPYMSAGPVR
jgi:hypothetical protein